MISRRLLLGTLSTLPLTRIAVGAVAHRLTVIHMNDFHSRHEPVGPSALDCNATDGKPGCFGGAARLAAAIAAERAAAEAAGRTVLFIDAGDQFQGSLFFTAWHGEVELAVMHVNGTEAMAVGNHEFDRGPAVLADFVRAAHFPVLSANIDASADARLKGLIKPYVVIIKDGLSIGIVGATTLEALTGSSPGPNIRINPPGPALASGAAAARADGAKLVLALSHLGVDIDRALAGHVPGIDAFIGGHSHTLLSDTEAGALGPAHQLFEGPAGRAVVTQAACFSRYLGRLDLDVADDGTVLAYGGDCRHVGLDTPEEPKVAAIVASYAARLGDVRRQVVGRAVAAYDPVRDRESPIAEFVAQAMLDSVAGADIAVMNSGGVRVGLPAGEITLGAVMSALPYGNAVATLKLRGSDLREALIGGLARRGKGAYPQVAGATITGSATDPTITIGGAPLDPSRVYLVVTNDFMRAGSDGYTVFKQKAIDPYDAGPALDEVVAREINARSPLDLKADGRLDVQ
jgi:5'-nucleotidase